MPKYVRVGKYTAQEHGTGIVCTLPKDYVDDLKISKKDKLILYRDGEDGLLIRPAKKGKVA